MESFSLIVFLSCKVGYEQTTYSGIWWRCESNLSFFSFVKNGETPPLHENDSSDEMKVAYPAPLSTITAIKTLAID